MSSTRQELHPAYVIHTRAYRDTSLIIEIFTPTHGRVSLLARGAKSGKVKKALVLQPFRKLHVSWAGRGDLPVLTAVEEVGESLRLSGQSLACGYYVNELVYYLVPKHEPAEELFVQYWPVVEALNEVHLRDHALRQFEFALLDQTGYTPLLSHEKEGDVEIQASLNYRYLIPDGPVRDENIGTTGVAVSGQTLLELASMEYSSLSNIKEARDLARALIHYHLNGRELVSRTLFTSFQSLKPAGKTNG